jgi:hypothetical protein
MKEAKDKVEEADHDGFKIIKLTAEQLLEERGKEDDGPPGMLVT